MLNAKLFIVCIAALTCFLLEIKPSLAETDYMVIDELFATKQYDKIIKVCSRHENAKNSYCALKMSLMYSAGEGVPKDTERGFALLVKASKLGLNIAKFGLAIEFLNGDHRDEEAGVSLIKCLANAGDAAAMGQLGAMYASGNHVPQDYILAYFWANLASSMPPHFLHSVEGSKKIRDALSKMLTREQLAKAQDMCRAWRASPCNEPK